MATLVSSSPVVPSGDSSSAGAPSPLGGRSSVSLSSSFESVTSYTDALLRYKQQHVVTIATGATCAYLGDERNLREFLVADETARWMRSAGHIVSLLLINDSMDPLNFRQLRVAVNKDPKLIERYEHWCGKPISQLPDPWGCHESYAAHFEEELLNRLHHLDCHPTVVSTAKLYERGVYAPYVRLVLEQYDNILRFLGERFPTYTPDKLFWTLCPHCRYIDETRIESVEAHSATVYCGRCDCTTHVPFEEMQGKLNWKLDCAVRWVLFNVDVEPFSKSYLEPQSGTFVISQSLAQEFFGGGQVTPFQYGSILMEKECSYKLLGALPSKMLRELMVTRPASDVKFSRELMVTASSRHKVTPELTYLDFVKQLLPVWLLTPDKLTAQQRNLVAHGIAFGRDFLQGEVKLHLPTREVFEGERVEVLRAAQSLLEQTIALRHQVGDDADQFQFLMRNVTSSLGALKAPVFHRLRTIVGQEQGLPVARFLFVLPIAYLEMVEFMLHLYTNSVTVHFSGRGEDESAENQAMLSKEHSTAQLRPDALDQVRAA